MKILEFRNVKKKLRCPDWWQPTFFYDSDIAKAINKAYKDFAKLRIFNHPIGVLYDNKIEYDKKERKYYEKEKQ